MTLETALQGLLSDRSDIRLASVRFLARHGAHGYRAELQAAYRVESVRYVRNALRDLLESLDDEYVLNEGSDSSETTNDELEELRQEVAAQVLQRLTKVFAHELSPLVGLAKLHAASEIADFEASQTSIVLQQVSNRLAAIRSLGDATRSPVTQSFDLHALLSAMLVEHERRNIAIELLGPQPFVTQSDESILTLAVANGLRNAVESCERLAQSPRAETLSSEPKVVVTWGGTDSDYWLSIIDEGEGLALTSREAFVAGHSSKSKHMGLGLPIVEQAMQSLGGTAQLRPSSSRGAALYLRWSR